MKVTDDHWVPFTSVRAKLSKKHRRLVLKQGHQERREAALHVLGKRSGFLSWRHGPAPTNSSMVTQDQQAKRVEVVAEDDTGLDPAMTNRVVLGNSLDPFDSLSLSKIGLLNPVQSLNYLAQEGWAPTVEYESGAKPGDTVSPFLASLIPLAVQNAELLAAILADAHYWHDGKLPVTDRRPFLAYRGQAMAKLRLKLSSAESPSAVDDATVLAMVFLMASDSYDQDESSEAAHRSALLQIVTFRGGLRALGPLTQAIMLEFNFWLQQDNASPPLFERNEYVGSIHRFDSLSLPPAMDTFQGNLELPQTFVQLIQTWKPSVQVLDILSRTQRWTLSLRRVWSRHATEQDYAAVSQNEAMSILDDAVHTKDVIQREGFDCILHNPSHKSTELLVVLVLILYLLNTMYKNIAQSRPIYQNVRTEARVLLLDRINSFTPHDEDRDFTIWSTIVVVDSYRTEGTGDDANGTGLMAALAQAWPQATNWESLKQVLLRGFNCGADLKAWGLCWEAWMVDAFLKT